MRIPARTPAAWGAYSPAPIVTPALHERIMREVIHPTLRGLAADGTPYTGFLYAGLMIAADGTPNVLEYNCRFGDPETQPVLSRLRSNLTGALPCGTGRSARSRSSCLGFARGARGGPGRRRLPATGPRGRCDHGTRGRGRFAPARSSTQRPAAAMESSRPPAAACCALWV